MHLVFDQLNWDKERVNRETGKIRGVIKWQRKAGTADEFEAAEKNLAELKESKPRQVGPLREQISELQKQIDKLESELSTAHGLVENMQTARSALREMVLHHIKAQHNREKQTDLAKSVLFQALHDAEQEFNLTTSIVERYPECRPDDHDDIVRISQQLPKGHPARAVADNSTGMIRFKVPLEPWKHYVNELRQELPKLESRLEGLQSEWNERRERINKLLEYWLEPANQLN